MDLRGIDAPEVGQNCKNADGAFYACGQQAASYLADQLDGHSVDCVAAPNIREEYRCIVDGTDVSERLVLQGFAVADPLSGSEYRDAEGLARRHRRGIWQGEFVMPAEWRQRIAANPPVIVGHR
jgi:endonuclease YncB( thermonuclease family)